MERHKCRPGTCSTNCRFTSQSIMLCCLSNVQHIVRAQELVDLLFIVCLNQVGIYLPCYDIFRNWLEEFTAKTAPTTTPYVPLVAGSLARSLACATCSPIELAKTRMQVFKIMLIIYIIYFIYWTISIKCLEDVAFGSFS